MKDYNFVTGIVLANASLDVALHDTYYVVAYLKLNSTLIPLATLPAGFVEFQNVVESEGKIFLYKRD